jgi:hypothetical protein
VIAQLKSFSETAYRSRVRSRAVSGTGYHQRKTGTICTETEITPKTTLEEADLARRNRSASVCLFVHSAQTAPAGLPELHRWGHDIVVVWDAEDAATDVRLKAGFLLAKALCLRANQHEEEEAASLSEMDVAIEAIRKQIAGFEEIKTSATTIVGGAKRKASVRLEIAELRGRQALNERGSKYQSPF